MVHDDYANQYKTAKALLVDGQSDAGFDSLCTLYNVLRKQTHLEDDSWELLTRTTLDLKKIAFGLPRFDGWDV